MRRSRRRRWSFPSPTPDRLTNAHRSFGGRSRPVASLTRRHVQEGRRGATCSPARRCLNLYRTICRSLWRGLRGEERSYDEGRHVGERVVNLSDLLAHHADRFGDRLAPSTDTQELTSRDYYERVQRTAGALRELGVERSDVVGVLLYNRVEFLELMGACAHLGAIFMPLNWRLAPAEVAYIADHAGARMLVSEPELEGILERLREQEGDRLWMRVGDADEHWQSLGDAVAAAEPVLDAERVAADDVMRLMYTSGTTSRPKGVM